MKASHTAETQVHRLHALRHFHASCCINRKLDDGLEFPAKMVQERLGHANIAMTRDSCGHFFLGFLGGDDGRGTG
jgi:integrase